MTPYLLIGALFVNGHFQDPLSKSFRTPEACVAELRHLGFEQDAKGYWALSGATFTARAVCLNPDATVIKIDAPKHQKPTT